MISEAELKELSFLDAPQMVCEVPGPKVKALMEESHKYEAFTRGGGGFPVILEHGKGATVKDADGNLYIDMAAGVAVNAVGRGHPKILEAIQRQAGVIMHTTDITNPKRIELAKKVSGVMPAGAAGQLPYVVLPGRLGRGRDRHQVLPPAHRPHPDPRLPGRLSRSVVRHLGSHHRVQLPARLGAAHRRGPAPAVRLLLPLPLQHDLPGL